MAKARKSSDQTDAHAHAAELAHALMQSRNFLFPTEVSFPLHSLGDVLFIGAMTVAVVAQFGTNLGHSEGISLVRSLQERFKQAAQAGTPLDEKWWTEYLENGIQSGQVDPDDLRQAIFQALAILEKPHQMRRLLGQMIKRQFPVMPPGRRHLIEPENYPELRMQADKWLPVARALIPLLAEDAQVNPKMRMSQAEKMRMALDILRTRFPQQCQILKDYLPRVESILRHKVVRDAKTIDGQARRLADALAGATFGLSPAYAVKRVQAARQIHPPQAK